MSKNIYYLCLSSHRKDLENTAATTPNNKDKTVPNYTLSFKTTRFLYLSSLVINQKNLSIITMCYRNPVWFLFAQRGVAIFTCVDWELGIGNWELGIGNWEEKKGYIRTKSCSKIK
ncbi:hypothetical protein [Nostoc sp. UHCC 0252]|uniref:hypothetical protein n=1 Tax=Nostoc sp. UHCC 0252 TaxID=3110241 RepID=UPI002B1F74A3|nr:hypothetical protein [Nostoc sp. UHCC 0252]MEA5602519.1 hypothetical protein [Nostoc sp. UHCC 0252]